MGFVHEKGGIMGCKKNHMFFTKNHICDEFVIRVIGSVSIGELWNMHNAVSSQHQSVYLYGGCEV